MNHWDSRFISLARHVSSWSKDPSTKVGAVIVDENNCVVSLGFNGFPRGIADDNRLDTREIKYEMIIHGEINALIHANKSVKGCTIYLYPFLSCSRCTAQLIQAGIKRVVTVMPTEEQLERWGDSFLLSEKLYEEAGVEVNHYQEANF